MNKRSINNNPIPWRQKNEENIKIASLNCMNLKNNYDDIQHDKTLSESTVLVLIETWLDNTELSIDGYSAHFNSAGNGKGIAVYIKDTSFKPTIDIKQEKMQITKLESIEMDIISVYRSEQGNPTELLNHIINMINAERATVILGDFNICYYTNRNNKISKYLHNTGFQQLVDEPTHVKGRHIDHLYFKPGKSCSEKPSLYRYTPYYSDHDAICATFRRTSKLST